MFTLSIRNAAFLLAFQGALLASTDAFALSAEGRAHLDSARTLVEDTNWSMPVDVQATRLRQASRSLSVVLAEEPDNVDADALFAQAQRRLASLQTTLDAARAQEAMKEARQSLDRADAMLSTPDAAIMVDRLLRDAREQLDVLRNTPGLGADANALETRIQAIEQKRLPAGS